MVAPIDDYSYSKQSLNKRSDSGQSSRKDFRWSTSPKKGRLKKNSIEKKTIRQTVVASRSFKEKFQIYSGERLHWLQVILRLVGTVIPGILPWAFLSSGYAFMISLLSHIEILNFLEEKGRVLQIFVLSLNIVLSLLLAFRTNTAHERFWEGRKLWGSMVNTVRNLARGIWLVIEEKEPKDRKEKEATLRLVVAFPIAMKLHLRREKVNAELAPLMSQLQYDKLQTVNHAPLEIAFWIGDYLQHQYERKQVNVYQLTSLHEMLDRMVDILGGCERILKTPVPLVYAITFNTLLMIYFLVLPLVLVDGLNWWTAPVVAIICFLFLSINEVGSEIEEPFGHDPNDLPLDLICNTMLGNVEDLIQLGPSNRQFSNWRRRTA